MQEHQNLATLPPLLSGRLSRVVFGVVTLAFAVTLGRLGKLVEPILRGLSKHLFRELRPSYFARFGYKRRFNSSQPFRADFEH